MRAAQRRWAPFAAAVAAATLLVAWTPASDEGTETTAPASADVQTDPAELVVHGLGQSRMRLMGENE